MSRVSIRRTAPIAPQGCAPWPPLALDEPPPADLRRDLLARQRQHSRRMSPR